MSENAWIAIAQIIAGFICALWQIRVARAITTPAQSPPKRLRKIMGRWTNFMRANSWAIVAVGLPVAGLTFGISLVDVSLRWSLVLIAFNSILLSYGVSLILFVRAMRSVVELSNDLTEVSGRTVKLVEALGEQSQLSMDTFKAVEGALVSLAEEARKKPGGLDGLRDTINSLLGD